MFPNKPKSVLLIDGDNGLLSYTASIVQYCSEYTTLVAKNAYRDWKPQTLASYREQMLQLGVQPVQQDRTAKNATDFALSMDAAIMLDKEAADIYFIVSNDKHFNTLCDRVHKYQRTAVRIGNLNQASEELINACDAFIDVEKLVEHLNKHHPTSALTSSHFTRSNGKKKVQTTPAQLTAPIAQTTEDSSRLYALIDAHQKSKPEEGRVLLSTLGTILRENTRDYQARFGSKSLSKLLGEFPAYFKIDGLHVLLKQKTSPKPPAKTADDLRLNLLLTAYEALSVQRGWVGLPELGNKLREIDKEYKTYFGGKKLSTWINDFSNHFEINGNRVRRR